MKSLSLKLLRCAMNLKRLLFLLVLVSTISHNILSQGFLKTNGKFIVDARGEKVILRGVGLGGWMLQEGYMLQVRGIGQQQHVIREKIEELVGKEKMEAFYNGWLANHTRKIDVDSLAKWGFNSVRLPMHYNLFTLPVEQEPVAGQNTWIEKGFAMTDQLLQWCAANNMYLVLDLHAAPGGQGNDLNISDRDPSKPSLWQSEDNQKKVIALWRQLAQRYKDSQWIGAYDIINEPNWGFEKSDDKNGCAENSNAPLKKLMIDITSAIREVDKNHIIIVEGNCWGNNYRGVLPLWDKNTVISFHKYWNYNDQASIQDALILREQNNAPIWLGESGENSNVWFRDAIYLAEKNEIGWAWWPMKKLGFNNPLEVKVPNDFRKILDYWDDQGEKPSAEEATRGLNELVNNLKLENCIYHKDIIDAMFRQTKTNETLPFKSHIIKSGSSIAAIDYDLGRNGYAYFDKDTANYWVANGGKHSDGNKGHMYRNDGVDIGRDDNSMFVDSFESGEWLKYTLILPVEKKFNIVLSIANAEPGKIIIDCNGKSFEVAVAAGGQWHKVEVKGVLLAKGQSPMLVKATAGKFKIRSIAFE